MSQVGCQTLCLTWGCTSEEHRCLRAVSGFCGLMACGVHQAPLHCNNRHLAGCARAHRELIVQERCPE